MYGTQFAFILPQKHVGLSIKQVHQPAVAICVCLQVVLIDDVLCNIHFTEFVSVC